MSRPVLGIALAATLLAAAPPAQDSTEGGIAAEWRELRARLRTDASLGTKALTAQERRTLLREFLERHRGDAARHSDAVLDARIAYGTLLLTGFQAATAAEQFAALSRDARAEDVDRRARAIYGMAQAAELQRRLTDAAGHYREIAEGYAGTRYADWAGAALRRLSRTGAERPRAGQRAAEFGPRLDVEGRPLDLRALEGTPTVLLFWSPDDPAGSARLEAVRRAVRGAGGRDTGARLVGFALAADAERTRAAAAALGWDFPQIACPAPFVDPVVFEYGVDGTPTWILLDARGRLLAWDAPPDRLAGLLEQLGGG